MKSIVTWLGVLVLGAALAGCGGNSAVKPASQSGQQGQTAMNQTNAKEGEMMGQQEPLPGEVRPDENVVHFDFDQSDIQPQYTELLKAIAAYLIAHPDQNVRIEGYTDERGTKAYNMALGQRRAQSVKRFLILQGVAADQIETVSYGEADPVDPRHTPEAWAKNRRAVVVYL